MRGRYRSVALLSPLHATPAQRKMSHRGCYHVWAQSSRKKWLQMNSLHNTIFVRSKNDRSLMGLIVGGLIMSICGCQDFRVSRDAIRLIALGDTMLGDAAEERLLQEGYDFPFLQLDGALRGANPVIANLEVAITNSTGARDPTKKWSYRARPESAKALRDFGVTHVDLANNHTLDYGQHGLGDTIDALRAAGLGHFGAGDDRYSAPFASRCTVRGVTFGLLGFAKPPAGLEGVMASYDSGYVQAAIAQLKPYVDILVASFHWGRNYHALRSAQIELARLAIDSGADIVLGHGPHMAQGVEAYNRGLIIYSLGNFVFTTPGRYSQVPQERRYSWIAEIAIENGALSQLDLRALNTDNKSVGFQPRIVTGDPLERLVRVLNRESGGELVVHDGKARLKLRR